MARKPAKTLVQALLGTRVGEDSLTDGLSYLLARDGEFLDEFVAMIGLEAGWRFASAHTQLHVSDGRVDLELVIARGAHERVIWVEAKTWTRDRPQQLEIYRDALEALRRGSGDEHELVTLAPLGNPIEDAARAMGIRHLTWQQVVAAIVLAAERHRGLDWRSLAERADAPARDRDRLDYMWTLENRGVAVDMTPLDQDDEHVAERVEALLHPDGVIGALLGAATQIKGFDRLGRYPTRAGRVELYAGFPLTPINERGLWLLADSEGIHVWFSTTDLQACEGLDDARAGFLAGAVFGRGDGTPLPEALAHALHDPSWELPAGIYRGSSYGQIWLVGARRLSDVARARTLSDQMDDLRDWAQGTIQTVLEVDPPPRWPPAVS